MRKRRTPRKRLGFEALEPRRLLDAESLVISEFMAVNDAVLADGLGEFEDWIEIYNPTDGQIDLDGWYLTDNDDDLTKWPFPAHPLDPGEFLVVFASGQEVEDFVDPAGHLHTNFKLDGDGENVALVMPDGNTVAHAYWNYPAQVDDVSYGLSGLDNVYDTLVDSGAALSYHVPTPGDDLQTWTSAAFDDSAWIDTVSLGDPTVVVTELSTGATRFVEIQNAADQAVAVPDWRVLINDATASDINDVVSTAWTLAGTMSASAIDTATEADFGGAIPWDAEDPGWVMVLDDVGTVVDFVAWGYNAAEIALLNVDFGPFTGIRVGDQFSGDGADVGTADPGPVGDGFVAFNDHVPTDNTHANATSYALNGALSGSLKDIDTGADTGVTLTISGDVTRYASNGASPASGTDAYTTFNGYVDFGSASGGSIELPPGEEYIHTFTGLDQGDAVTYEFTATAIRGSSSYTDRWTLVTLEGAASATAAHSSGNGVVVVGPMQVAVWTGHNSATDQGFVAAWTGIDPGGDGAFSVRSSQYTGATPGVGSGTADGSKGYGLNGLRLEEVPPAEPLSWLVRAGDRDTNSAADFVRMRQHSQGSQNPDLSVPFTSTPPATTGIGFSNDDPAFEAAINTDVESAMLGQNASLWSRIEFDADGPADIDALTLRMQYDDGFVAYLNGVEIARRNAPETLAHDSAATAEHPNAQAVLFEEIDVSDYLTNLVTGTNVLAIHGLNVTAADSDFLITPELIASSNLGAGHFMLTSTPGAANVPGAVGFVDDTAFSVDRGFYDAPFDVEITTDTPDATIMVTFDGTKPTASHGTPYTGPIHVDGTTTLRAIAVKPGYEPTNVDTHTYIFLDNVVNQDYQATLDRGLPSTWGSTTPDYGMDPDVIGTFDPITGAPNGDDNYSGIYASTIHDDLKSLPTLSIVMNADDMFGTNGIYTNSTSSGIAWERETSVELIYPDGTEGFQVDSGIRIQGGAFRSTNLTLKHSLRLLFKDDYGPTKLEFPWFGEDAAQRFDTITLRAGANDGYSWSSAKYTEQYIRDQFGRELQAATGNVASHGTFVHLYINGVYWGLYNPVERPDHSFSASYLGGDKDDYDAINSGSVTNGDLSAWNQMISQSQAAASSLNAYLQLQGLSPDGIRNPAYPDLLDVENYADYLITNIWGGNHDWPHKNWWASRDRTENSTGFKFYNWDFENTMGNNLSRSPLNKNVLNKNFTSAGAPHASLEQNDEYRMLFADRVHRYFFNSGVLAPNSLISRYNTIADAAERSIVAESARWGDQHHHPPLTLQEWYDADGNYNDGRAGRGWIVDYYLPQRTAIVLQQFKDAGLYPTIDAPTFRVDGAPQYGGPISAGQTLTVTAGSGTIYYTLDGTDPRNIGGSINAGASSISSGATIPIADSALLRARLNSGGQWSALSEAVFLTNEAAATDNLVITELNFHPHDPTPTELGVDPALKSGDFEFVEMMNVGTQRIDLYGTQLVDGIAFEFDQNHVVALDPGEHVVIAANPDAMALRYPTVSAAIVGQFNGSLDDSGERLVWENRFGQILLNFDFDDAASWPGKADGKGASLVLADPASVPTAEPARTEYLENGDHWDSSVRFGGTPGAPADDPLVEVGVFVNEVISHTDLPWSDTIELHNITNHTVDLAGWYLSDSWGFEPLAVGTNAENYKKYRFPFGQPAQTQIPAGRYLLVDETHFNTNPLTNPAAFALNGAHGDDVWLMRADASGNLTHFSDHAEFGAMANPAIPDPPLTDPDSWGRWPEGPDVEGNVGDMYPMISKTLGAANSGPRLGSVIVSEIHYHPDALSGADDLDFIEIYNTTSGPVDLSGWRLERGIDFDFPHDYTLPGYSTLIVVPFDLSDTAKLDAFTTEYGITEPIAMLSGYSGQLSNGGERVRLVRPDDPPAEEPLFTPHLLEDEVNYADAHPWPTEPDGDGLSLTRSLPARWGNAAASWTAGDPSPGEMTLVPGVLSVTAIIPTPSGFVAYFSLPPDPADLNLYDIEARSLGQADVSFIGSASGAVEGSLIVGTNSVTFVAVGGPLPADDYTVTLRSATNGFKGLDSGELLDGNGDGTPGGDFAGGFTIGAVNSAVISLPDFVRAANQPVNVPAMDTGLPLRLSDAVGVESVSLSIEYDPELLTISGASLGADAPPGSAVDLDTTDPGVVTLSFTSGAPLPAGAAELVRLTAVVPSSAAYGDTHVVQIGAVSVNQGAIDATADHAIHVTAFFGDVTGNESYSGLDAQRTARVAVGLDSGFEPFPTIHPVVMADVTGNGAVSGFDAQRIAQVAIGLDVSEIPAIPQQPLRLADTSSRSRKTSGSASCQSPDTPNSHESGYSELTYEQLSPILAAAVTRIASGEHDTATVLNDVTFEIVELPGDLLGTTSGQTIQIDISAAGYGWFVDSTPWDDAEFTPSPETNDLTALPDTSAVGRADLLTTVLHELGHVLGFRHEDHGVMDETLPLGTRRLGDDELPVFLTEEVIDKCFAILE